MALLSSCFVSRRRDYFRNLIFADSLSGFLQIRRVIILLAKKVEYQRYMMIVILISFVVYQ